MPSNTFPRPLLRPYPRLHTGCCADARHRTERRRSSIAAVPHPGSAASQDAPAALRIAHPSTVRSQGRPALRAPSSSHFISPQAGGRGTGNTGERRSVAGTGWPRPAAVVAAAHSTALRASRHFAPEVLCGNGLGVGPASLRAAAIPCPDVPAASGAEPPQSSPHNEGMKLTKPAVSSGSRGLRSLSLCSTDVWFSYGLRLPVTRLAETDHGDGRARC